MEKAIQEVENFLIEYIFNHTRIPNCVLDNLDLFYTIACEIEETLEGEFKNGITLNPNQLKKVTLMEKIEIVKQYFQEHEIEFDIEKYIMDGTIAFIDYNQLEESEKQFDIRRCFNGNMKKEKNHKKLIDVSENGFICDIPILVHEISHFRDESTKTSRNQISNLLTEALAYGETLISADYLYELGFSYDAQSIFKFEGNTLYQIAKNYKKVAKLFLVYKKYMNISKTSYQAFFEEIEEYKDYEENIKFLKEHTNYDLIYETWYLLGLFLAPFLLNQYKKDKSYMEKLKKLHIEINKKDFLECLDLMGLENLSEKDRIRIVAAMYEIKEKYFKEKGHIL